MTEKELLQLKTRAEKDDPIAMFEYAQAICSADPAEANKYIVLSAQLGNPDACEVMGDRFQAQGDLERARFYYRTGAKAGRLDCSVKRALINMNFDEQSALRELEELAESGVQSACAALATYHKSNGNRTAYTFWKSLAK